jgi:hypothetical protein
MFGTFEAAQLFQFFFAGTGANQQISIQGKPESWDACRFSGFLIVGLFLLAHKR